MPEHTPGPWHRNIKPAARYPIVFAGRNTHVAQIKTQGLSEAEQEANCNLIAAAPDMLAALEKVQDWLAGCSTHETMQAMVSEAIAKATA